MADRRRVTVADQPLVASSRALQPAPTDLYDRNDLLVQYESWQDEAWAFYETLGEFAYGTTWRANMLSRVRLLAAEKMPGGDEPAPLDSGPAVELINDLGGLDGSTNELMKAFGLHLGVPGDSWLVGEELAPGVRDWSVKSALEVKLAPQSGNDGQPRYQIKENERRWRLLPAEAVVLQIWDPDPRLSYRPYSLAKPALPVMRKIDLYDRHIVATLVSRLAMNGFLMIPEELSFPVRDEYATAADPFVAELIDFAAKAIKNPGTASAAIPFPIKGKAQYLEQFRHLAIANGVDEQLLKARDAELTRLARTLQIPEEVLTGMGEVNHWSAWQLEEQTIKTSICPITEVITSGLTRSYLRPMLQLGGDSLTGPNGGAIIAWYDVSELTAKPDRSREAIELYDRNEIKGETLRREVGFDEADAPADNELANQILKWMAHQVQTSPAALQELTGVQLEVAPTPTSQGAPPGGSTPPGVPPPGGRPGAPRLPVRSPPATRRDRPAAGQPALTAAVGTNGHNGRDPNDNDMRRFRELFGPPGGGP